MTRRNRNAVDQVCFYCGSNKTGTDCIRLKNKFKVYQHWRHDENGNPMCTTCHTARFPKRHDKERDKDVFLWFGKKIRYVPRIINNQCSICQRKRGEGIKLISMHHEVYIACLPWFGRIEICQSCHASIPKKKPYETMIRMKTRKGKRYCIIISQTYKRTIRKRDSKGRYC